MPLYEIRKYLEYHRVLPLGLELDSRVPYSLTAIFPIGHKAHGKQNQLWTEKYVEIQRVHLLWHALLAERSKCSQEAFLREPLISSLNKG